MQQILYLPRNGCALHGSLQTLLGLKGVVPVVHGTAGCAYQNYLAAHSGAAGENSLYAEAVPGTAMQERHIIFGGASRLREQIKNVVKVVEGTLYVVLNSCPSAMVGDDVDAMCREAQEQGTLVVDSLSAGFHGDVHYGYGKVLSDLFGSLEKILGLNPVLEGEQASKADFPVVNVFGILPKRDVYYKGDIAEIARLLSGANLCANTFFNAEAALPQLARAKNAALSIVFGRWGLEAAQKLESLYGVPYLQLESVPIGIEASKEFLIAVAEKLAFSQEQHSTLEEFLEREAKRYRYYLSSLTEILYELHAGRKVAIVADESRVRSYERFLRETFGAKVQTAVITDFFATETDTEDDERKKLGGIAENLYFTQDSSEINRLLSFDESDVILASSLEASAAENRETPLLPVSYPIAGFAALTKTHVGINGALTLAEEYVQSLYKKNGNRI